MDDAEKDRRLRETEYLIEATHFEQFALWEKFAIDSADPPRPGLPRFRWRQDNPGLIIQVGTLARMPVNLELTWDIVNGHRLCFWWGCSMLTDGRKYEQWLRENMPKVPRTDAMNFAHCFDLLRTRQAPPSPPDK